LRRFLPAGHNELQGTKKTRLISLYIFYIDKLAELFQLQKILPICTLILAVLRGGDGKNRISGEQVPESHLVGYEPPEGESGCGIQNL